MKDLFIASLFLFFSSKILGQTKGTSANLGYSYLGTNTGYVGGEYTYRIDPGKWQGISFGVGTHFGSFNGDFKFIPEAHVSYSKSIFFTDFSATPHNLNPNVGLHFANFFRLKFGYSWEIGNKDYEIKGFTLGINFLLGTLGSYDKIFHY